MCFDPLTRAQLLVAEAIRILAHETEVSARDPAVARAVLSRLRDAEAHLQDAEAQFSRRKGWEITMDVITRVATEIVLRALASSNCLLAHPRLVEIIHNAPRFYPSKTSACEWAFAA